jgi:PAS domain S-box-containing protein
MERVKQTGEPQQFRARYLAATGEYHWFATFLHTQKDSKNNVIRYFGLQWNIDEEKRKEDEMRARDNVWGSVLRIFPGWVWVSRPDGALEFASDGAREYFGEAFGASMADRLAVIHPDDRERRAEAWKHQLETEEADEIEIRVLGKDRIYRWFSTRSFPMRDAKGRLERWVSISWDIDERKKAEEERRSKEESFRKIADGVPACICIMAPDGTMVYANKVASMALGKPIEDILGNQWMQHIHPEQYDEGYKSWMHCVATKTHSTPGAYVATRRRVSMATYSCRPIT